MEPKRTGRSGHPARRQASRMSASGAGPVPRWWTVYALSQKMRKSGAFGRMPAKRCTTASE